MKVSSEPVSLSKNDTSQSLLDRVVHSKSDSDWRQFCRIYQPFLARHVLRCGVESADVDDVVQECLATIVQSISGFSHNGRVGAFRKWLKTVVSQRISRYLQRTNRKPAKTNSTALEFFQDHRWEKTLESHWDREHDQFVVSKVAQLIQEEFTRTTWLAFEMQVFEQIPVKKVALELGISVNAALIAKSRVLTRLRSICHQMVD